MPAWRTVSLRPRTRIPSGGSRSRSRRTGPGWSSASAAWPAPRPGGRRARSRGVVGPRAGPRPRLRADAAKGHRRHPLAALVGSAHGGADARPRALAPGERDAAGQPRPVDRRRRRPDCRRARATGSACGSPRCARGRGGDDGRRRDAGGRAPQQAIARIGLRPGQKNLLVRLVLRHPTRTLTAEEANLSPATRLAAAGAQLSPRRPSWSRCPRRPRLRVGRLQSDDLESPTPRTGPPADLLAASVVGRVEARALEVDRDRVQHAGRRRTAHLALGRGILDDPLHHLEPVVIGTAVLVDRHANRVYRARRRETGLAHSGARVPTTGPVCVASARLRIAIVTDFYYPSLGGITEHVDGQARELANRGHEVTVITGHLLRTPPVSDDALPVPEPNFEIVRMGAPSRCSCRTGATTPRPCTRTARARPAAARLYRERGFDVVHVHAPYNPPFPAWAIDQCPDERDRASRPSTACSRDPGMDILAEWTRPWIERLDGRICVSRGLHRLARPVLPLRLRRDPERHRRRPLLARRRARRRAHGRPPEHRLLRPLRPPQRPRHGDRGVPAAAPRAGRRVRLVVIGDGPLRKYHRQVGEEPRRFVHWAGRLNRSRPNYLPPARCSVRRATGHRSGWCCSKR